MWFTHHGSPVASSDRDDGKLGDNDSRSDGVGDFFGAFNSETDMAVVVSNDDGSLEPKKVKHAKSKFERLNLNMAHF